MTEDDLRRSGPVVQISRSAIRANLRSAARSVPSGTVDLRGDAYGHGASAVEELARELGLGVYDGAAAPPGDLLDACEVFGVAESADGTSAAMRMTGIVLSLKPLRAGEGVSYGFAHRATSDTTIALVTGGYAQGVVRALGGRVDVSIDGTRHPIIGRVAMDVCVVDVGTAHVERGAKVVLFGDPVSGEPSIRAWAESSGLHPLELTAACGDLACREVTP